MLARGSLADPFYLQPAPDPYSNGYDGMGHPLPDGRALIGAARLAGPRIVVIVGAGESTQGNHSQDSYVKTSARIWNLHIGNGGLYEAANPMLGPSGLLGCTLLRIADKLVTANAADDVVVVPIALGGSRIEQWTPPAGIFAHRIGVTAARLKAAGLTPTLIDWQLGTNDNGFNPTQAAYTASLEAVFGKGTPIAGSFRSYPIFATTPIFSNQASWAAADLDANIRAAQAGVVDVAQKIYFGVDTDAVTGRYDSAHFDAAGSEAVAVLKDARWRAVLGL